MSSAGVYMCYKTSNVIFTSLNKRNEAFTFKTAHYHSLTTALLVKTKMTGKGRFTGSDCVQCYSCVLSLDSKGRVERITC